MVEIKKGNNKFYVGEEKSPIAEVTYVPSGDKMIVLNHTFVSPELRGQNMGYQLVKKVVDYARDNGLKIYPTCSFAVKEFQKNDYHDVLYEINEQAMPTFFA